MKIIGSGLIAQGFYNYHQKIDSAIIFASGVSNSSEVCESEFSRELSLIRETIEAIGDDKLIYFSSCSIDSGVDSPYVKHKLKMEFYLKLNRLKMTFLGVGIHPQMNRIKDYNQTPEFKEL